MVAELLNANTGIDIPEHASHVTRAVGPSYQHSIVGEGENLGSPGDDLTVAQETAAAEVARVSAQLFGSFWCCGTSFFASEIVDGADVIQATTSDKVARGRVCASHDPAGTERDSMNFVGSRSVPDEKLSVL